MKNFDQGVIPNTDIYWIRCKKTGDYLASFNGKKFTVTRPSLSVPAFTKNKVYVNVDGMCGDLRSKVLSAMPGNIGYTGAGCDLFCDGGIYVKYNPNVANFNFDQFCQGLLVSIAGCI